MKLSNHSLSAINPERESLRNVHGKSTPRTHSEAVSGSDPLACRWARAILKQYLTLNQGPKKSGRSRHQNGDVATETSDDRASCEKLLHTVLFPVFAEG